MTRKLNWLEIGDLLERLGYVVQEDTCMPNTNGYSVNGEPLCDAVRREMRIHLEEYAQRQGAELGPNDLHDALLYLVRRSGQRNRR